MNKLYLLPICMISTYLLTGCNSGSTSTPVPEPTPPQTTYNLSEYFVGFNSVNNSCTNTTLGVFVCNAKLSQINIITSYTSTPASYLVIPTQASLPSGINLVANGTCNNVAVTNYGQCGIGIMAKNAESGSSVTVTINGSLGEQSFYTFDFK